MIYYLLEIVKTEHSGYTRFGGICLTENEMKAVVKLMRGYSIEDHIKAAIQLNRNLFYLPESKYKDKDITRLTRGQMKILSRRWFQMLQIMDAKIMNVNVSRMCRLPNGIQLFFDPNRKKVLESYANLVRRLDTVISAGDAFEKVLATVIRLEFLHVSRTASLQLLVHCLANIFNSIRATRCDGHQLLVPGIFMGLYRTRFEELTAHLDISTVPEIPAHLILKHASPQVLQLTKFNGWGQTWYVRLSEGKRVEMVKLKDEIFDHGRMSRLWVDLMLHKQRTSSRMEASAADNPKLFDVNRTIEEPVRRTLPGKMTHHIIATSTTCGTGFWLYEHGPTSESQCCSVICLSLHSITLLEQYSLLDCCEGCNVGGCPIDGANRSVQEAINITVENFGLFPKQSVRVIV